MQIAAPQGSGDSAWLALRLALWPDVSEAEHLSGMVDALARGHYVRLAVTARGSAVGFVEASKRVDYVNGTSSSPVAFLEGLYVAPESRRKGVAVDGGQDPRDSGVERSVLIGFDEHRSVCSFFGFTVHP